MQDIKLQIEQIAKENENDILIAWDADFTLTLSENPAFSHANIVAHTNKFKDIIDGLDHEEMDLLFSIGAKITSHKTLEDVTPSIVQHFHKKDIRQIVCSAICSGYIDGSNETVEDWRYNVMKKLGMDFNIFFEQNERVEFTEFAKHANRHPLFYKGQLLTNGENGAHNKGTVLQAFTKKIYKPKVIVLVDDRLQNLVDGNSVFKDSDVKFFGIEYTKGRMHKIESVDENHFCAFWQAVKQKVKQV